MKAIIFSGTTEGRKMSERLSESGIEHIVSVATAYGELVMQKTGFADIRQGRLESDKMEELIAAEADMVFDATHPYAREVSENIRAAAEHAGKKYVRILRREVSSYGADVEVFEDAASCAKALGSTRGNILLTTGSKELGIYTKDPELRSRLFVRVLPSEESIRLCNEAGISGRQIVAMQGPFSEEMDIAVINLFDIKTLVTKSSGRAGGFEEKLSAASAAGADVYVIGRPPERSEGMSASDALEEYFGIAPRIRIDIVGTGPGRETLLTQEASDAIKNAELICGARRMTEPYEGRETYPYYLADDVIALMEKRQPESMALLFSGDSGFYSGADKMRCRLEKWLNENLFDYELNVHPGISSFAYLAARARVPYQDAAFCSMHGKTGDVLNLSDIIGKIRHNRYSFVLMSGPEDVNKLAFSMNESGLGECEIVLGYELSYPDENIIRTRVCDAYDAIKEGLYTALVINSNPMSPELTKVIRDEEFLRGKVPMTKENIRHLSILKLRLKEDSVLYDIGSGTGSIACEAAALCSRLRVYAIEMKDDACDLTEQNARKFGLSNIEIVHGQAPEAFGKLDNPTHAFIGGSAGELRGILKSLSERGGSVRVVINAVSLETMAEIQSVLPEYDIEDLSIEQISVSRSRELGAYHLMTAENPVMIATFTLGGRQ